MMAKFKVTLHRTVVEEAVVYIDAPTTLCAGKIARDQAGYACSPVQFRPPRAPEVVVDKVEVAP